MSGPLRIGLNALYLLPGETGGTETYARSLLPALAARHTGLTFVAFVSGAAADELGADAFGERVQVVPVGPGRGRVRRSAAEQLSLPKALRAHRIDLLHSLGSTGPRRPGIPSVLTLHDVIYATNPEAHTRLNRLGLRVLVPLAVRGADRIVAVSKAAAEDIRRVLGVPADRVDVVYEGGRPIGPATPEPELRERFDLQSGPIVLSVSARRPHKNLERLLRAFADLPAGPLLVLPGYPTSFEGELATQIDRLGLERRVRVFGWVSDRDLEGLYRAARCFVFPSLAEGFGLPVLEAMQRGVPVACSNASALPEVAGGAARYFDPLDVNDMGRAITELLEDESLRTRLAEAGRERARMFSWERAADETAAIYQRAWESSARRAQRASP